MEASSSKSSSDDAVYVDKVPPKTCRNLLDDENTVNEYPLPDGSSVDVSREIGKYPTIEQYNMARKSRGFPEMSAEEVEKLRSYGIVQEK